MAWALRAKGHDIMPVCYSVCANIPLGSGSIMKQAGAELGQAQPQLGIWSILDLF